MKRKLYLQLFTEGGAPAGNPAGGNGGQGSAGSGTGTQQSGGTYTYEQLEEIASARTERATRSAIADYLRKQGLGEDEITTAISEFKTKKANSVPDVATIEKERDEAISEKTRLMNEKAASKRGVKDEYLDYVLFKVEKKVTDKLPFDKALDDFLKENPSYSGSQSAYRVSTGAPSGGGDSQTGNEKINDAIRDAFNKRR